MKSEIPSLRTSRLLLSAFQSADAEAVYHYASNPNVAKTVSWNRHSSKEDSAGFIQFVRSKYCFKKGKLFHCWAIRKKEDAVAIGSISFIQLSERVGRVDYALSESEWGNGIVTEAANAVIDWAFQAILELQVVKSGGLSENAASLRVMEKCGMRLEKNYRVRFPKFNNEEREVSDYKVTREAFWRSRTGK